ncbi:hypothetical protein E2F46_08290 [Luteimonas aestuarii]|uniref:DUF4398 domain-containing protein n=1 Tax=Luteimonas aestuarii TaxID=453837 RepID=A0A4R5TST0_9GAMM|nr:hypothetical protein [Luteimonas aestuarii]TDK24285.1 hypothetical protein E2F46_08290 [Luteimonas aestuarii]
MARPFAIALAAALLLAPAAHAQQQEDPDRQRLTLRLQALEADPATRGFASYERLQARQALEALPSPSNRRRADALQVAEWRVETAELAARTEGVRRQIDQLDRERSDLLVEASRREAARARAEAERLRIQAQIQAEETQRLRLAAESEATARQEAETVLEGVSSREAARLRAARQREAELARQEAELLRSLESNP